MPTELKPKTQLAIFGASRGVGREALRIALQRGHSVVAVARHPEELKREFPDARVIQGSVTDLEVVAKALQGTTAVLCALGAPAMTDSKVRSEGTRAIIAGMRRTGVKRIVAVSVMGARESRKKLPFFFRYILFPLYLRRAVADHNAQEDLLASSGLDWTAVRPPNLEDGPATGNYVTGAIDDWSQLAFVVKRADVANYMLDCALSGAEIGETPLISAPKKRGLRGSFFGTTSDRSLEVQSANTSVGSGHPSDGPQPQQRIAV